MRDDLPLFPHADCGNKDCCGCIIPVERDDMADLTCNECGAIIRTVSAADATRIMVEMSLGDGYSEAICPQCGAPNLFTGFAEILAYTCQSCGRSVAVE